MRDATSADAQVIVFARAPVAGRVKTRLIPALGAWRAAALHRRLVLRALATGRAAGVGPVALHVAGRHTWLERLAPCVPQRGADLGERMHRAARAALLRHHAVIVVGADCPSLEPGDLRRAARWLAGGCDAVLAPAEDGGYALLGLRRVSPLLFAGVPWGTGSVLGQTQSRLAALGWRWRLLRTVWDVDRPADLARLERLRFRSLRSSAARPPGARR